MGRFRRCPRRVRPCRRILPARSRRRTAHPAPAGSDAFVTVGLRFACLLPSITDDPDGYCSLRELRRGRFGSMLIEPRVAISIDECRKMRHQPPGGTEAMALRYMMTPRPRLDG